MALRSHNQILASHWWSTHPTPPHPPPPSAPRTLPPLIFFFAKGLFNYYWWFYLHRSRVSVFPVWWLFLPVQIFFFSTNSQDITSKVQTFLKKIYRIKNYYLALITFFLIMIIVLYLPNLSVDLVLITVSILKSKSTKKTSEVNNALHSSGHYQFNGNCRKV